MTKFLNYTLLLLFFLGSTSLVSAQTVKGCMINNQAFIYNQYVGNQEFVVNQYYKPKFETYSQSSTAPYLQQWYNPNNCPHFGSFNIGSPQCAVQGVSYVNGNSVANLGNTVTYTLVYPNCSPNPVAVPIDNYALWLTLVVGFSGAFFIAKHKKSSI